MRLNTWGITYDTEVLTTYYKRPCRVLLLKGAVVGLLVRVRCKPGFVKPQRRTLRAWGPGYKRKRRPERVWRQMKPSKEWLRKFKARSKADIALSVLTP